MKPQRIVYSPTRSRRLNEMLGLIVVVAAGLLLLALVSYTPSDPSFNTVGGAAGAHPAHNWTGLIGAYVLRSPPPVPRHRRHLPPSNGPAPRHLLDALPRRFGSTTAKSIGLVLWLIFAPAAIALLPGNLLWRHTVPIAGLEGRILADVPRPASSTSRARSSSAASWSLLSLYLTTTFLLSQLARVVRPALRLHPQPLRAPRSVEGPP